MYVQLENCVHNPNILAFQSAKHFPLFFFSLSASLHQAFNFFGRSKSAIIERHKFFDPSRTPGRPSPPIPKAMLTFTLDALGNATKYPDQRFEANQHVIFAAVRDPTERFISSIGQGM